MTSYNNIAVFGHRGWVSSGIVAALLDSGAPIKILYRPESSVADLPTSTTTVKVDLANEQSLVEALEGVDIFISIASAETIDDQRAFLPVIVKAGVKLFVPSDLACRYDAQGNNTVPRNAAKVKLEAEAKAMGIKVTTVLTGNFAEFALKSGALGVDMDENRFIESGDNRRSRLNLCTLPYVGAAYVSMFTQTPTSRLENKYITLSELTPSGDEIIAAMTVHAGGVPPKIFREPMGAVGAKIVPQNPFALALYCRKIWANGSLFSMLGDEEWVVEGYQKATVDELVGQGKLGAYREMPPAVKEYIFAGLE